MKQVLHSYVRCLVFALRINTPYFNLWLYLALPIVTGHFLFVFGLELLGSKSQKGHKDFAPNNPDRLRSPHSLSGVKWPMLMLTSDLHLVARSTVILLLLCTIGACESQNFTFFENGAILGHYTASGGNSWPTFPDDLNHGRAAYFKLCAPTSSSATAAVTPEGGGAGEVRQNWYIRYLSNCPW